MSWVNEEAPPAQAAAPASTAAVVGQVLGWSGGVAGLLAYLASRTAMPDLSLPHSGAAIALYATVTALITAAVAVSGNRVGKAWGIGFAGALVFTAFGVAGMGLAMSAGPRGLAELAVYVMVTAGTGVLIARGLLRGGTWQGRALARGIVVGGALVAALTGFMLMIGFALSAAFGTG